MDNCYSHDVIPNSGIKPQPVHTDEELAMCVRYPIGYSSGVIDNAAISSGWRTPFMPYKDVEREPPRPVLPDPPGAQRRAKSARPRKVVKPVHQAQNRARKTRPPSQKEMANVERTRLTIESQGIPVTTREIAELMTREIKNVNSDMQFLVRKQRISVRRYVHDGQTKIRMQFFGLSKPWPPLESGLTEIANDETNQPEPKP